MNNESKSGDDPIKELKWMANFFAKHGHEKKAIEIYQELVNTLTARSEGKSNNVSNGLNGKREERLERDRLENLKKEGNSNEEIAS